MIAQSARDSLTMKCGPVDRIGKRRITALFEGQEIHNDEFSPFEAYRRTRFAEAVDTKLRDHLSNGDGASEQYAEIFGSDNGDDPDLVWIGDKVVAATNAAEEAEDAGHRPSPVGIASLIANHPHLAEPIIEGFQRRGETLNVVSASKIGKSWLMNMLALSFATGRYFLDTFRCICGRVLVIDLELFPATVAHRYKSSAEALGIHEHEYAGNIDVICLRGQWIDLFAICAALEAIKPGTYDLVILDALYRAIPAGFDENSNAHMTQLFNAIDKAAARMGCGWCNVIHSSKGEQGSKTVVDVGSGAGSQARATDSHLVLRQHDEPGVIILDAAVRSFAPIEPLALRWQFPIWHPAEGIDTGRLKGRLTMQERRQSEEDSNGISDILDALESGPATARALRPKTGLSRERLERLLDILESSKRLVCTNIKLRGNECREYRLVDVGG
jgi:hypothetical protein